MLHPVAPAAAPLVREIAEPLRGADLRYHEATSDSGVPGVAVDVVG